MIPLNIVIGDRTYRIKTEAKDEEAVRQTLKLINEKIIEFKTQFAGKDMQDYIAMVIIWYATQTPDESSSTGKEVLVTSGAEAFNVPRPAKVDGMALS